MMKRICAAAALVALMLWMVGLAGSAHRAHDGAWGGERIGYQSVEEITVDRLRALRREVALGGRGDVAGWAEVRNVKVAAESTGGTATVDAVYVDGDAQLVVDAEVMRGRLPAMGDGVSCAVDDKTALALYGSLDVIGKEIEVDGRAFEIGGVFSILNADVRLAICPLPLIADPPKMMAISLELRPKEGVYPADWATALLTDAGIGTSGTLNDRRDERHLMRFMVALGRGMAVCAVFAALLDALRRHVKLRLGPMGRGVAEISFYAALGLMLMYVPGFIAPPSAMLPTRWSDFAFWPKLGSSWMDAMRGALGNGIGLMRLIELESTAKVIGLSLAAVVAALCAGCALHILIGKTYGTKGGWRL